MWWWYWINSVPIKIGFHIKTVVVPESASAALVSFLVALRLFPAVLVATCPLQIVVFFCAEIFDKESWFAFLFHEWNERKKNANCLFRAINSVENEYFCYVEVGESKRFSSSFSSLCRKKHFSCGDGGMYIA